MIKKIIISLSIGFICVLSFFGIKSFAYSTTNSNGFYVENYEYYIYDNYDICRKIYIDGYGGKANYYGFIAQVENGYSADDENYDLSCKYQFIFSTHNYTPEQAYGFYDWNNANVEFTPTLHVIGGNTVNEQNTLIYFSESILPYKYIYVRCIGYDNSEESYYSFAGNFLSFSPCPTNIMSDNYIEGYNQGYVEGQDYATDQAYESGKEVGYNQGYEVGYEEGEEYGYNQGVNTSLSEHGLTDLFNTIFSYPINFLSSIFNFEFMGINIASLIMFIISIGILGWVIKRFI